MIDLNNKIVENKRNLIRKTYTVKELADVLGIGINKARLLTHAKGFPVIVIGKSRLTIISKLDVWLEDNLGEVI